MQVTHKISFQMGGPFEQHTAEFMLAEGDIGVTGFSGLNLIQRMFILNALTLTEGLLFQQAEGYITEEEYRARVKRIASLMPEKVLAVFKTVLKSKEDV